MTLGTISVKYRRYRKIIMSRVETNIQPDPKLLNAISCEVRRDIFTTILRADSGHLGGNSSSTELLVALYFGGFLRVDPKDPGNPNRDRVLIRGHEGPLRYYGNPQPSPDFMSGKVQRLGEYTLKPPITPVFHRG